MRANAVRTQRSGCAAILFFRRVVALVLLIWSVATSAHEGTSAVAYPTGPLRMRQAVSTPHDVILAGGLNGHVYALDAWTGRILWRFDSGGPLVQFSRCGNTPSSTPPSSTPPPRTRSPSPGTVTVSIGANAEVSTIAPQRSDLGHTTTQPSPIAVPQLFPSYNGHLFHLSHSSEPRELELTMMDLIHANGPVRLQRAEDVASATQEEDELSNVVLVGEKQSKLFRLDPVRGLLQPFVARSEYSQSVLFGRSEYHTQVLHLRNASASQCFSIAEFFVQFADSPRCERREEQEGERSALQKPPKLVVVPRQHDLEDHAGDNSVDDDVGVDGSIIAAFDPLTNEPLWEFEVPQFEVSAVFGVSTRTSSTFFQWNMDGPSTTSKHSHGEVVRGLPQRSSVAASSGLLTSGSTGHLKLLPSSDVTKSSSSNMLQVARAVPVPWRDLKSRFRLRKLSGHFYVEMNDQLLDPYDDESYDSGEDETFAKSNENHPFHSKARRRRVVFWESMESNGKRGVFITYQHVGAITIGVTLSCVFIAWGCYLRGMSAKLPASTFRGMNANQFFAPQQLTIERPGGGKLSIAIMVNSGGEVTPAIMKQSLPMLMNGESDLEDTPSKRNSLEIRLDPETEAMLLEKFAQLAVPKHPALTDGSASSSSLMRANYDDPKSQETSRSSLMNARSFELLMSSNETCERVSIDEVPFVEEIESSASSNVSDDMKSSASIAPGIRQLDVSVGGTKPLDTVSWGSESTDTSEKMSGSLQSVQSNDSSSRPIDVEEKTESKASSASNRKKSDASSSSSNNNEVEVIFPFVCQSRFANEFVEISPIGKGGFGQVILAENRLDGRRYAIKRVGLNLRNQTSKTLQKFLREVKILALLDHPNIVRYYQAWLEKVDCEEGKKGNESSVGLLPSDANSETSNGILPPKKNYSTSNLLGPVSEMEFTNDRGRRLSYINDSLMDMDADDGFEWERNSSDGLDDEQVWKEEDLVVQNTRHPRHAPAKGKKRLSVVVSNSSLKDDADLDDSTSSNAEKCDHWLYIQMQYCAGRNLGDFLALPNRPRELAKVLKIFMQIASALAHVHSCGLIHRDLKPANIFVADTDGESIKLGDFGLSRYAANVNVAVANSVVDEQVSSVNMTRINGVGGQLSISQWSKSMSAISESGEVTAGVGTYLYASPEQVAGKKYNARTDMYSLGMILFEMCHEPFATTMERYITLRNARDCLFPPDFVWHKRCPEIMEMLEKLLHNDPMLRPTADEVVRWSQDLYESTLAYQMINVMRSPVHHGKGFSGSIPSINIDTGGGSNHVSPAMGSCYLLRVEARMETHTSGLNGDVGERRLPNHNLLKEICDVVEQVSDGKVEIKRCGLHLQDEGVQVLEFVLDLHDEERYGEQIVRAIEALPTVHTHTFHPTQL